MKVGWIAVEQCPRPIFSADQVQRGRVLNCYPAQSRVNVWQSIDGTEPFADISIHVTPRSAPSQRRKALHKTRSALPTIHEESHGIRYAVALISNVSMRRLPFCPSQRNAPNHPMELVERRFVAEDAPEVDKPTIDVVDHFRYALVGREPQTLGLWITCEKDMPPPK